jgi:ATP-dependent DNA helicase RecG
MLGLTTPLSSISGVGPRFAARFARLGIRTVRDLLYHFPSRYEDFSHTYKIADLEPGQHATIQGVVRDIELRQSWRKRMVIVEATIEDDSGVIHAAWFNQPYIKNALRVGTLANFSGKVSVSDGELQLSHPTYEPIRDRGLTQTEGADLRGNESGQCESASVMGTMHTARLVPVYPETYGITSKGIRYVIQPILASLPAIPEWIPDQVRNGEFAQTIPEINKAIRDIHFPEKIENADIARRRFEFEDLFLLQLLNAEERMNREHNSAPAIPLNIPDIKKIISSLPFPLTLSQKKSLWEILQDMEKSVPMNRLLQGDVGSGKTIIAALAAIATTSHNLQTVFMAPTEVLARQHFETLKKLFAFIGTRYQPVLGLVTGHEAKILYENDLETDVAKKKFQEYTAKGIIRIIIGTHAVIQKTMSFKKLGLVIVDEQHRFGVQQRLTLARGQTQTETPHFLSMSATPIPRTLMLTVFGDLDMSMITEMPSGRKKIITKIVAPEHRARAYQFIREEIKKGRQAFVICPRIEPSALSQTDADLTRTSAYKFLRKSAYRQRESAVFVETKTVKEEYEKLSKTIFPDLRIGMLHGQLKSKEKEKIMAEFYNRAIDILVSTSVIEVGVDVPNASIMMIEGSERFGLAQLYQFRGRVGRGVHQSYCFLFTSTPERASNSSDANNARLVWGFTDSSGKTAQARLKAIVEAKNGFELAERDLALRGPGEFIGKNQAGMPDVSMRALQDPALIQRTREAATRVLESNPALELYPLLKEKLAEFRKKLHAE